MVLGGGRAFLEKKVKTHQKLHGKLTIRSFLKFSKNQFLLLVVLLKEKEIPSIFLVQVGSKRKSIFLKF